MSSRSKRSSLLRLAGAIVFALLVSLILCAGPAQVQSIDSGIYTELEYRHIGPVGNRLSAVAGVTGDPQDVLLRRRLWRSLQNQTALRKIVDKDLAELNTMLRAKNFGNAIVPQV
jgi:hypothetical protein